MFFNNHWCYILHGKPIQYDNFSDNEKEEEFNDEEEEQNIDENITTLDEDENINKTDIDENATEAIVENINNATEFTRTAANDSETTLSSFHAENRRRSSPSAFNQVFVKF